MWFRKKRDVEGEEWLRKKKESVGLEIERRAQLLDDTWLSLSEGDAPPLEGECEHCWTSRVPTELGVLRYCERCDAWILDSSTCVHRFTTGAIGGEYCKQCGYHPRVPVESLQ